MFTPAGRFATMDKSSGHVHSITSSLSGITAYAVRTQDAQMLQQCRQRTVVDGRTYTVNLLFDYSDDVVAIRSQLPFAGRVEFTAKSPVDRIRIRIPTWVDRSTMRLERTVGAATDGKAAASYADIDGLQAGESGALTFSLPVKIERETVDGIDYTTTWIGSQIIQVLPRGTVSPLPF